MINRVVLIGRLKDPVLRKHQIMHQVATSFSSK